MRKVENLIWRLAVLVIVYIFIKVVASNASHPGSVSPLLEVTPTPFGMQTIFSLPFFWPFFWIVYIIFAIKLILWIYNEYGLSQAGIYDIDKLTGDEFEERLAILFRNLGYRVTRTGRSSGDYGVDLVIEKEGIKTAVQAKCYKHLVGEDAIREVYTGKGYYHCTDAMVVTNSNFTKMAWPLANSNNVKLWSRNYLIKVLLTEKSITSKQTINK